MSSDPKFHLFTQWETANHEFPQLFTYPFCYTPHPLCEIAAKHLMEYVYTREDWREELDRGKMMGVLVVAKDGETGYLAAYSGNLAHCYNHEYFVPAICDLLSEKSFFVEEEQAISALNSLINSELKCEHRSQIIARLSDTKHEASVEVERYRSMMRTSKKRRDELRRQGFDNNALIAESQFQKAELKRLQQRWQKEIASVEQMLHESDDKIQIWKEERHNRSIALQHRVFEKFVMLNGRGEERNLIQIFADTPQGVPPAGAGECAAPKLLQYAFKNGYRPLAMAEFWVGVSPKEEIRHHGHFYPSCKAKCEPILTWMLTGIDVEPNPLENNVCSREVEILYDDDCLTIVNKPAGLLSVSGKLAVTSLAEMLNQNGSGATQYHIVHRLDMATSGIVIFAKDARTHRIMQSKFKNREITKRYVAIVEGEVKKNSGIIDLPLILNPNDRPRQMVSHEFGKKAVTRFEAGKCVAGKTRVIFYPETGRTHQLRVHASHPEGLNAPIVGDRLYGIAGERLYLHAEMVQFVHPVTGKEITINCRAPF